MYEMENKSVAKISKLRNFRFDEYVNADEIMED